MYLTQPAISQTLAELGTFAPGTELITDYMLPPGLRDQDGQSYAGQVGPVAAERGEPWLTCPAPDEMSAQLTMHGFGQVRQISQQDSVSPRLWARSDTLHPIRLSMLATPRSRHDRRLSTAGHPRTVGACRKSSWPAASACSS